MRRNALVVIEKPDPVKVAKAFCVALPCMIVGTVFHLTRLFTNE